ncbi:MAG: DUF2577 domain-containing protein [Methanosarcinales archaeon]|jgi:hypothetical protein|nr:DUF2577 domain-containing protein [Methanosarcinales archaeon]
MTSHENEFLRLVKLASIDAVNESAPAKVVYGIVDSEDPIKIRLLDTKDEMILGDRQLILTEHVTTHKIEMELNLTSLNLSVDWATEPASGLIDTNHSHEIKGIKPAALTLGIGIVTMKYALEAGDKVCLLRVQGGQKYIVVGVTERSRERGV